MRVQLHLACDTLFNTFQDYVKVPIPLQHFTTELTDKVIENILCTKHVQACIPYYQDETDPDPDHYVLFITNNCQTIYTKATDLYDALQDFPPGLVLPPVNTTPTTPSPPTHTKILANLADNTADDIAFLQLLATATDPPSSASSSTIDAPIPPFISTTTKRPHQSSGSTMISPNPRIPRNQYALTNRPPNDTFQPTDGPMEVDRTPVQHNNDSLPSHHQFLANEDTYYPPDSIPDHAYG
jgi:hypothetical protein